MTDWAWPPVPAAVGSSILRTKIHLRRNEIDPLTAKIVMRHNVPCFQTDELARYFGVHGPLITISSASAGSGIAIGMAMRWLQSGQADFVLAGGGEGLLPLNIIGFDLLGLLDSQCCSPFSRSQGMSIGEGAGFVTLERYASAIARGAPILAELHGFAVTSDAFDAIQFDPSAMYSPRDGYGDSRKPVSTG